MARIPITVAQRGLETGNVLQYPNGSPVGRALEGAGDTISGVADYFKRKQEQKEAFDAAIRENEFTAQLGGLEQDAKQNATIDGSGLHDGVYGQIDPVSQTAVKPGSFDTLFDGYLEKMPAGKREEFAKKRELYRMQGSNRLAKAQYEQEQNYYDLEVQKGENQITNAMLAADPNDTKTFEDFKKQGLDLINKSGWPPLQKEAARLNWEAKASETLFQSKLQKDPAFASQARAALGLAPAQSGDSVSTVVDRIIGVESGGNATAKNPNSSAEGLGQFIDSTWLAMIKKHRPDIAKGKSAAQILALKTDGALSREMTTAYTRDNAEFLTNRGIQTTPGNLYLAHFLGPMGAVQALKADPSASVASIIGPDAVRANSFLAGKTVADLKAWSDKKMGGGGTVKADPTFASIPANRRLVLANQADVQMNRAEAEAAAAAKAGYIQHKDAVELSIVKGDVADEAMIVNDGLLNDGDKATLIRSLRTQNEQGLTLRSDLAAFNGQGLALDPYSDKDKGRADRLYTELAKKGGDQGAIAGAIIEQTGVVPQPVLNAIRQGLSSQNPADVANAAQVAQRISAANPAALARRSGGGEVQKTADDFDYYVNTLNLAPEDAARRIIEERDPAKQRDRKALEPAAKEFEKEAASTSLQEMFDDAWFSDPQIGFTPGSEYGIKAEFQAIARDRFFANNGNAELALNQAQAEMKRLYGVTRMSGRPVVMKHPPEKYWPKQSSAGGFLGIGADPYQYVQTQLFQDISSLDPTFTPGSIQFVTTPETDADVKAGRLPGYTVMWQDANGNYQTIPGKVWRPALDTGLFKADQARAAREQQERVERAIQTDTDIRAGRDREYNLDQFLDAPAAPQPYAPAPRMQSPQPTLKNNLEQDRRDLIDRSGLETSVGGAL